MRDCCRLSWRKWIHITVAVIVLAVPCFASGAANNEHERDEKTVAVLPFEVHGSEQYGYLQKALPEMFASRVSRTRGYRLINPSRIHEMDIDPAGLAPAGAADIGRQVGADVVLYGSLTVLLETWSLDASLVEVSGESMLGSFSQSGPDIQALIPGVDAMARDMVGTLGEGSEPEKAIAEAEKPEEEGPQSPIAGFEAAEPLRRDLPDTWSGPEMKRNITGLAAGDVTGDGLIEMVLGDEDAVYIYRVKDDDFRLLETIDAPANTACMAVDVADINGSGRAEIFVTAKNNRDNLLRSFVLEYRDGAYQRILENAPWFYRAANDPETGPFLLGQRHQLEADPFQAEIVRLEAVDGDYKPAGAFMEKGQKINALGLAFGRIAGKQEQAPVAVAFDSRDRLQVVGTDGDTVWASSRQYGGSTLFLEGPREGRGDINERYYLSGRIL
ncbi:MAG: FG-GAP-like repeat-containing protein, partial [Thermodesulfobacteriota bacterium]